MNIDAPVQIPLFKRLFDVIFSIFFLILLAPFLMVAYILSVIEKIFDGAARGPWLYCEKRISAGKPFDFYKIRTCHLSAYEQCRREFGSIHTAFVENDKNFTRVGRILKRVYLDEAPQLFNVLIGDMSLVGPRPKPPVEYEECLRAGNLTKKYLTAGLTGIFQSYKGHWPAGIGDKEMDGEYYELCRTGSGLKIVWNDCKIIARTIKVILEHKGI
ncbi:MAG: hypothetical protein A3J93_00805 [Candidatus Magasanikbacteria bacterium RIFOXYC2_FULL_42_28]|uniref:Bacterial sugar transferase domain-containing protein n=1 Tax=Candidatus Magasanikbacteria bacterium RIFOXYC2_FULL_42_28 TaxID=1798704 RepID=A0A1F6NXH1_9BACT|nr:MAG: hypothetical protein A3J93_00805 [Candidatus Magasanikbacteria bacterium RIFOXYC2_FULL_42_28]